MRRRKRRSWLRFGAELPEAPTPAPDAETLSTARAVLQVLEQMPADLRIPFALRYIDHMELRAVADCCQVSLATIKRRLQRAEQRFLVLSRKRPELRAALAESAKWGER